MVSGMAQRTLYTYEVYTVQSGERHQYLCTTSRKKALLLYVHLAEGGILPRLSIDGRQLTIDEAGKLAAKWLGHRSKTIQRPERERTAHEQV